MKTLTALFLLSVACIGCRTHTISPADAELRQKLKAVNLSDGVSQPEAEIIAESYFARNVGCGALTGIQDGGDRWIVDGKFGFAGEPIKGFFIDKRSGRVTSPIGPSYDDPLKIFP
jgi:hypothetical protein